MRFFKDPTLANICLYTSKNKIFWIWFVNGLNRHNRGGFYLISIRSVFRGNDMKSYEFSLMSLTLQFNFWIGKECEK